MTVLAEVGSAFVSIVPSARGFGSTLNRQVGPQVGRAGTSIGAGLGKSMLKGFIAIGVGLKIAQFLGDSVAEAREANKVAALTANVIKTTGGAAKVSAGQVARLATAISLKTGIDDEQIQSSENLILTFKNIRREGAGLENIFARATRASVDLSAAGFGDTAGTAKMLGKALNDPVKGLTALGRAGVTFTAQQQEQIKALAETGKRLQAQKIILAEVESQVKGAAEAQATNSDKARVALGNLKETIGQALIPALDAMAGAFANNIAPAITTFVTNLQSGEGSAGRFATFFRENVVPVLKDLGNFVTETIVPAFRDALPRVLDGAREAFDRVRKAVADNKPELKQLFNAAKRVAEAFYTRVVPAVYALAGRALKNLGIAITVVIRVVGFMVRAFNTAKNIFNAVRATIQTVITKFNDLVDAVRTKTSSVVSAIKKIGTSGFQPLKQGAAAVKSVVVGVFNAISSAIQGAISRAQTLLDLLHSIANSKGKGTAVKGNGRTSVGYGIGAGIGQGVLDGTKGTLYNAQNGLDRVLAKAGEQTAKHLKEQIRKVRDQLSSVRSDFASLVEPVASNFTQGLFDFTSASAFTSNLSTVKGTLTTALANFKKLLAEGLSPGFLYRLFQEGGPALINSLASLDMASAQAAGSLFGDVMSLSDQLGGAVAGATNKGEQLENQTQRLEKKLDKLIKHVDDAAIQTGREVNGAASSGRRRGVSKSRRFVAA